MIYNSVSKGTVLHAIEIVSKKKSKPLAENIKIECSNYHTFANNMYYILQMGTCHSVVL